MKFKIPFNRLQALASIPGDLPVPLECDILMLNMICSQTLSQTPACLSAIHTSRLTSVQSMTVNSTHSLASTSTVELTVNDEEDDVDIRNE